MTPNLYYDNHFNIDAVKILPGEYYATARPILIVTVVGSCVAACIRDRVSGIGGMTHFTLPIHDSYEEFGNGQANHGNSAMELLINQLLAMGAQREHLEAKIFGGCDLLQSPESIHAGRRNCDFLRSYLELEKIPVLADDLLGHYPRKIYFFPGQGKVLVKKLLRQHNATILQREQEYIDRLRNAGAAVCDV
ncbi:chemoreceptor glutamine deamidase CheD [Methylosarcina fibrata]|uniref:chemoreceptor glutamine deamidase CheD n=1 Tax=Methylosarcina fibrata TaxID=105972 RepID=UPI0003672C09|nr:chemoreceptor glutamine deamidase CheD [Methylosarcina fibrata]